MRIHLTRRTALVGLPCAAGWERAQAGQSFGGFDGTTVRFAAVAEGRRVFESQPR
jgi:hypothetical protein